MIALIKFAFGCAVFTLCVSMIAWNVHAIWHVMRGRRQHEQCSCDIYQGCAVCGKYRRR